MSPFFPLVSLVITTKNEEAVIESLLRSIQAQTYKQIETIVVDNKSTDRTVVISKKYTTAVFSQGPERSAQRNFGVKQSHGNIIIFLDADMILTPKVVESCVKELKEKNIVAVVIPEQSIGEGYWSRCKILERKFYLGVPWIERARCFKREILREVGGYDETMSGPEDYDFPQKVANAYGKKAIARTLEYIIHNEGRIRLWEILKKKYYYGLSMSKYLKKQHNVSDALVQGNIISRYLLFFKKPALLLKEPLVSLGMLALKTLELTSLSLGTLKGSIRL